VNDDFCDCADCSDEPSTSASASLDRVDRFGDFHCRNVGHRPGKLSYTDVDDGRCNYQKCCDGSDESAVVDGKPLCPNRCEELGELWRMVEKRVNDIRLKASNVKTKLVKDAAALKKGVEEKIKSEEIKIEGTEANVKHWETKLKEAEELSDKHKTASPRSKVAEAVQLAKDQVEKYKTLLTELKEQRDDAEGRLKIVEAILKKYKEEYKPSYNLEYGDQSGKNVIAAWETYLTGRASADRELNEADDKELNDLISGGTINWDGMIPEAGATEGMFKERGLLKFFLRRTDLISRHIS
jgi:protein kinase C substrate 80K-H